MHEEVRNQADDYILFTIARYYLFVKKNYFIDLLIGYHHRELLELVLKYLLMDLLQLELVLLEAKKKKAMFEYD
jgi:hypothetical protein